MRIRVIITLAVLVVGAGCTSSTATDDAAVAATPTPSPSGPARTVTVEDATAVNDAWFEAYEAGDVTAMIDLYAPDAELPEEGLTLEDQRVFFEWKVAEGTEMLPRDCTASEVEERDAVAVECEYAQQEYLSRAVDGPAVPHMMTMVVGPDGIERLESDFGDPAFNVYADPFYAWMQAHHPDDAQAVVCCGWDSVEDARQSGELVAQYADEWAAWLEDNPSCTWRDTHCQGEGAQTQSDGSGA